MDHKDIALELLVRSGNPKGVKKFYEEDPLGDVKTAMVSEAGVYSAIKVMWDQAEGGIESDRICQFFSQPAMTNYFNSSNNTVVLEGIVDVLEAGTHAQMEAYARITAIDVLGVESLAGAIRRNIDTPNMREKVTKLVNSGYGLVFCPHDIDAHAVNHYFLIIDKWRDFVNPTKVAENAIEWIFEDEDSEGLFDSDYNYRKEFVYAALDKLVELTDKGVVSRLVHAQLGENETYSELVQDGKVDNYSAATSAEEPSNAKFAKALKSYEKEMFPDIGIRDLAEAVEEEDKVDLAKRMGYWFDQGRMRCLTTVANFDEGRLYDHETARGLITASIATACEQGDLNKLDWSLGLPEYLIDTSNPGVAGVATAYRIDKETKKE